MPNTTAENFRRGKSGQKHDTPNIDDAAKRLHLAPNNNGFEINESADSRQAAALLFVLRRASVYISWGNPFLQNGLCTPLFTSCLSKFGNTQHAVDQSHKLTTTDNCIRVKLTVVLNPVKRYGGLDCIERPSLIGNTI